MKTVACGESLGAPPLPARQHRGEFSREAAQARELQRRLARARRVGAPLEG
jgi:hypothetical protein